MVKGCFGVEYENMHNLDNIAVTINFKHSE